MTEDKDKAGSANVNKAGHVKKVTVTTNNRMQAGFNPPRRKKANHWAQSQLTKSNAQLSEKYKSSNRRGVLRSGGGGGVTSQ